MMKRVSTLGAALFALWFTHPAGAYSALGPKWPSGTSVVMHLQLGSTPTLIDGSPSWNATAEDALGLWNPYLNGVSFRVMRDSSSSISLGNSINNVSWGDNVYGEPFGSDVIAVAPYYYFPSGNRFAETDVVFNRAYSWNSYRGNLRAASSGGRLLDFRRVALHEFGHSLGLGHPDEHGQSVTAIMNSRISNVDSLQADDTNGARAVYGGSGTAAPAPANRPPTVTASCNPCSVQAGQTSNLSATATDADGDSLSYQWAAQQGTFSNSNAATPVWTAPTQTANVTATVTVQDGRGGRATASVTLQVVPRDTLRSGDRLLAGQFLTSASGRYRLLYQSDGNLVLYDDVDRTPLWASNTGGTSAGQTVLQPDGNLVIYDAQVVGRWGSGTAGNPNARVALQNDGNLVVYRADGVPLWGTR